VTTKKTSTPAKPAAPPIRSITFLKDHRCFKKGDTIDFQTGLNLLVGDQGSGKSTLLGLLGSWIFAGTKAKAEEDIGPMGMANKTDAQKLAKLVRIDGDKASAKFFDAESNNLRTLGFFDYSNLQEQLQSKWGSHGQYQLAALLKRFSKKAPERVFFMDEPDMALSPRNALTLRVMLNLLVVEHQIFAAVHNPFSIEGQPRVLDMQLKAWISGDEYLARMKLEHQADVERIVREQQRMWEELAKLEAKLAEAKKAGKSK
jgi:predicted ATPase